MSTMAKNQLRVVVLPSLLFGILLLALVLCCHKVQGSSLPDNQALPCTNNSVCEPYFGTGSQCVGGLCTNPFEQGCLYRKLPWWTKVRVCNSDDPPNAAELGLCRTPQFDYLEIRMHSQNWESVFFEAWILQIVLSEMLDVPTSIETGIPTAKINFYNASSPFQYGISDDWGALARADQLLDCRLASRDPNNYQSCAHVISEVWDARDEWVRNMVAEGILEPTTGLGALGQESWFMPKFTAESDPSLVSFVGLAGEQNRRKLAETFPRPTTWWQYCTEVSPTNCTVPDGTATRPPKDASEYDRMFVNGLFLGHFRFTGKNNCTLYPTTCTGHIADYPCGWSSFVTQQTYWLDIALESDGTEPGCGGYQLQQLQDMWPAAHATKSNLMMMWWSPERLYQTFMGTDSEFTSVLMPPTTTACINARVTPVARCSNNTMAVVGSPIGVCQDAPNPLQKVMSQGLYYSIYNPSIPEGKRSPAYDVINLFTLSSLQIGEFFDYWVAKGSPREAICQWAVDNMETLLTYIPPTFPRVVQEVNDQPFLLYGSIALGALATVQVLWTWYKVYRQRNRRVIRTAQVEFLFLILAGAFCVSLGAIVTGMSPTNASCVAEVWLVDVGYTLELVPLIVKVAAINRLMHAARQMRRVVVNRTNLFGGVALIIFFVLIFLTVWTVVDPPHRNGEYDLSGMQTANNETIILLNYYCSSQTQAWRFVSVGWNALLLLCASVLAFQTRNLRQDFNESQTLAMMTYSHFVFVILLVITFALASDVSQSTLSRFRSLIYSVDTIATLVIYFVPKFLAKDEEVAGRSSTALPPSTCTNQSTRWLPVHTLTQLTSGASGIVGGQGNDSLASKGQDSVSSPPRESAIYHPRDSTLASVKEDDEHTYDGTHVNSPTTFRDSSRFMQKDGINGHHVDDDEDSTPSAEKPLIMLRKCRCCGELESEPLVVMNPDPFVLDPDCERLFI